MPQTNGNLQQHHQEDEMDQKRYNFQSLNLMPIKLCSRVTEIRGTSINQKGEESK